MLVFDFKIMQIYKIFRSIHIISIYDFQNIIQFCVLTLSRR